MLLIALVGSGLVTRGDGGMFVREMGATTPLVSTPAQEALLLPRGNRVTVVLRTHFNAGPRELAWLVPVPAVPESVREGKEEIFQKLAAHTAPRFYAIQRKRGPSCGCAADMAAGEAPAQVTVHATGTAGVFQFHTLSANNSQKLIDWLKENSYRVPDGTADVLGPYVDRAYAWIAMRIRPEETQRPTLAPHPVVYSYRSDRLTFPMIISKVSAAPETEVILYVGASVRYGAINWENSALDKFSPKRAATPSGTTYEALIREKAAGSPHLFVTEFAQPTGDWASRNLLIPGVELPADGFYLTRLRALVKREAMDCDVDLAPSVETGNVYNQRTIHASAQTKVDVGTVMMLGLGVGLVYLPRRGRG